MLPGWIFANAPQNNATAFHCMRSRALRRYTLSCWQPMSNVTRRAFIGMATAIGATVAWGSAFGTKSHLAWRERRDLFPEGVASGDPDSHSVLLWTRRPPTAENLPLKLNVEVAEDEGFARVMATATTSVS